MTTDKPSALLNRYASAHADLERLREEQAKLLEEMRLLAGEILSNPKLETILSETGVRVGYNRLLRFDRERANTTHPLVVEELTEIPYAHDLDDEVAGDDD